MHDIKIKRIVGKDVHGLKDITTLVKAYEDSMPINKMHTAIQIGELAAKHHVYLFYLNNKVIGGVAGYRMPSLFNNDIMLSVMFIYFNKEDRRYTSDSIRLLEAYLRDTDITKIVFGVLNNDVYKKRIRFFNMLGYKELETHLYKEVLPCQK